MHEVRVWRNASKVPWEGKDLKLNCTIISPNYCSYSPNRPNLIKTLRKLDTNKAAKAEYTAKQECGAYMAAMGRPGAT